MLNIRFFNGLNIWLLGAVNKLSKITEVLKREITTKYNYYERKRRSISS